MNLPLSIPKFSFSALLDSCYLLKPVSVLCLVSLQLCRFGLDSLKQSCREFPKLQLFQLAHLRIRPGSQDIGPRIGCYFWLSNVAMFQCSVACVVVQTEQGGMADQPQAMNAAWAHRGAHKLAAGPPIRPRGPQGCHDVDRSPLTPFPSFSLPLCALKRKGEPLLLP
jgi:hypothetical protein